ncbi:hypothetical protein D3C81_2158050 [compost metagenome]
MKKMSEVSVNLGMFLLNPDQRPLFKADIGSQQRKKVCFLFLRMFIQRNLKIKNKPTQLLDLLPAFLQTELFILFEGENNGMPLSH